MIKEYWDDVDPEHAPKGDDSDEASIMVSRPAIGNIMPEDMSEMVALSVGCDSNEAAVEAARRGARIIVADPSEEALDGAFKDLARQGMTAELVVATPHDLQSIPEDSVDLVSAGSHITVIPDLARVFRELHRVLRPRGRLLLIVPHPLLSGGKSIAGNTGKAQWLTDDYFSHGPQPMPTNLWKEDHVEVEPRLRTLEGYINPLLAAGFTIERVLEPKPDPRTKGLNNTVWNMYNRIPQLLIVKAVRTD
jgi:SAM-dependent methyltransferase